MGINLRTETVVQRIDIDKRIVYSSAGEEFPFDKLILCTGWEYEVPDVPNVDLDGIVYIKNIRRAMEIDKHLDNVKKAVVWQSKPLGVELIEALPPAPPPAGKKGRPRKKGQRLPTLQYLLEHPTTIWQSVCLKWYGGKKRQMEITSGTAVWYHNGKAPVPIRWVLIRDPLGEYDPIAVLCTSLTYASLQIAEWFVQRWQLEVTFEEVRAHLGVETQRQWSDKAIARTTPLLLGLFSWVTLAAHILQSHTSLPPRQAAWYSKTLPTFSDTIAFVRFHLWPRSHIFCMSSLEPDMVKLPRSFVFRLVDTLCYAA